MGDTNRPTLDQVIAYLTGRLDGMTMPGAVRMTTAARDYLVELRDELERVKEYAREATVTMNSLYGACGKFCDDTIFAFRQRWS